MRAAILACVVLVACAAPSDAPPQPLPFDHALHATVRLDDGPLACVACHPGAERGDRAGLPALETCLRCHMRPQGDPPSDAEARVRAVAASGEPLRWIQVTRNPGHVHFAHGAHVTVADMECADCHGEVTAWSEPPTLPEQRLVDMSACLACHRERGAPTDCATCHQ
jgi:c(7)-type cytochrome triheme protein